MSSTTAEGVKRSISTLDGYKLKGWNSKEASEARGTVSPISSSRNSPRFESNTNGEFDSFDVSADLGTLSGDTEVLANTVSSTSPNRTRPSQQHGAYNAPGTLPPRGPPGEHAAAGRSAGQYGYGEYEEKPPLAPPYSHQANGTGQAVVEKREKGRGCWCF